MRDSRHRISFQVISQRTAIAGAFVWSFLEATVFFVIPDVWLSFCGLSGARAVVATLGASVLGSMLGAAVLWLWPGISALWPTLPGYYPLMTEVAGQHLMQAGAPGLRIGPTSGIPYRFYIQKAHELGIDFFSLMAHTPMARLSRIALAPIATWLIARAAAKVFKTPNARRWLVAGIATYWVAIYVWYWGFFLPGRYSGV